MSDVIDNKPQHRFELAVDGHLAATYYKIADGVITFIHTEVPPELGGKGIGSKLIKGALDQVRAAGLKVIAQCPFVKALIEHPNKDPLTPDRSTDLAAKRLHRRVRPKCGSSKVEMATAAFATTRRKAGSNSTSRARWHLPNYRLAPSTVIITHTETPRALRGRGIASELVQGALQLIRADGLKVVAGCGFRRRLSAQASGISPIWWGEDYIDAVRHAKRPAQVGLSDASEIGRRSVIEMRLKCAEISA